jgi:hypothetical protein
MERVKLTPAQVEALEKWKGMANRKQILIAFTGEGKQYGWLDELECLKSLSFEEMALALCDWYEVEEPFKVGDWVVLLGDICEIIRFQCDTPLKDDGRCYLTLKRLSDGIEYYNIPREHVRLATNEEIAAEKERRKWSAIGRKVGEYKTNDIVYHEKYGYGVYVHGQMIEPFNQEKYSGWHDVKAKELKLICPVEHRFDMKEDE